MYFKDYSCEKDIRKGWKLWSEVVHNDHEADIFVSYYHLFRSLRIEDIEGYKQKQSNIKYIGLVLLVRFEEHITKKARKKSIQKSIQSSWDRLSWSNDEAFRF